MPAAIKKQCDILIRPNSISSVANIENERKALHEDVEIKCFYEGTTRLLIGTQTIIATPGDVVVVNPFEFHATVDCDENKGRYHLFMVPLDFFGQNSSDELDLRNLLLTNGNRFNTLYKNDKRMSLILNRAAEESQEKAEGYKLAVKGLMMEFFAILIRNGLSKSNGIIPRTGALHCYKLVEPALRFIRDNYAEEFTVEKLANLCKVSKHYFCRIFKNVTGKTAMEYIRDYRLSLSNVLLTGSEQTITEISEKCGFESVNYFCRCYKKEYGISPNKHRKSKK